MNIVTLASRLRDILGEQLLDVTTLCETHNTKTSL